MDTIERKPTFQTTRACIQDYLEVEHNRLANLMDQVPGLAKATKAMCEAILRVCSEKKINPRTLKPRAKITPDGKIFIDLNLPHGR